MFSNPPDSDQELIRLLAQGHEPAFRTLFDTYNKRLFTFAMAMTKSAADAEEIVQECFTRLWTSRASLPVIEKPGQYLYKMVRNRTLDHLRKTAREQKLINEVWSNISQQDHSLEELLLSREYQQLIDQAVAQLPQQKQYIYRLSREKEFSHEEIAAITGLSRSRVNNILVETLRLIKTYLEQHSGKLALLFWLYHWEKLS